VTKDGTTRSGFSAVSRALLAAVAELAEEFPTVALPTIYECVGDARPGAACLLPDLVVYRAAVMGEARRLITAPRVITLPDVGSPRLAMKD
jgi:hypothetical protein